MKTQIPPILPKDSEKFLIENSEIEIKREIGRGEFGRVSLGIWRSIEVAVKEILISNLSDKEKENFYKEVELMKKFKTSFKCCFIFWIM